MANEIRSFLKIGWWKLKELANKERIKASRGSYRCNHAWQEKSFKNILINVIDEIKVLLNGL